MATHFAASDACRLPELEIAVWSDAAKHGTSMPRMMTSSPGIAVKCGMVRHQPDLALGSPEGLPGLADRGHGFKYPSPDRCLRLQLAEVFVVQLPERSSVSSSVGSPRTGRAG